MVRQIIIVLLFTLSIGGWHYLDYMNKKEQRAAGEIHQQVLQMQLNQTEERAKAKAKFEARLRYEFTDCQFEAERARNEFLSKSIKPVPKKPDEFIINQAILNEAAKIITTRKDACQQAYDTRLKQGS